MASKRELLKNRNLFPVQKEEPSTIVDDLAESFQNYEKPKKKAGRPKTLEGEYKPISARLKIENYNYAKEVGGRYGGINGYLNYLIEQDRG